MYPNNYNNQPYQGQPPYNPSMGGPPMPQPGYQPMPQPGAPYGMPYGAPPQGSYPGAPPMGSYPQQPGPGMHTNYPPNPGMHSGYGAPPMHGAHGAMAPMGRGNGTIRVQLAGVTLKNKDLFSKSDPYYTISRVNGHGKPLGQPIHKSEVCRNNLNPNWQPFTTSVQRFCDGDYHQPLRIDVYDFDTTDRADLMGYCTTTLREIMDAHKTGRRFPLTKERFMSSGKAGEIVVRDFQLWQEQLPM